MNGGTNYRWIIDARFTENLCSGMKPPEKADVWMILAEMEDVVRSAVAAEYVTFPNLLDEFVKWRKVLMHRHLSDGHAPYTEGT